MIFFSAMRNIEYTAQACIKEQDNLHGFVSEKKKGFSLLFFALNLDSISHHLGVLPKFEMAETSLPSKKLN